MELDAAERDELVRELRATIARQGAEIAVKDEALLINRSLIGSWGRGLVAYGQGLVAYGQGLCSAVGLPLDEGQQIGLPLELSDEGHERIPELLVDLTGAEQSRFKITGS